MALFETEGIILKSYNLSEADKIVVIFTKDSGLIRGVAKGAKRLKSRFGGTLEPFSVIRLEYFQKEERELVSIRQVDLIKSHFESAANPDFLQKFSHLFDLLNTFAPPHDPNENLYRMVRVCLETASGDTATFESVALYFKLWLLRLGGYLPDWKRCDRCKKDLSETEQTILQINFHLLCSDCRKSKNDWIITSFQRAIFINAQKLSPTKFVEFSRGKDKDLLEISHILRKIISYILGRDISDEKVLRAVL